MKDTKDATHLLHEGLEPSKLQEKARVIGQILKLGLLFVYCMESI